MLRIEEIFARTFYVNLSPHRIPSVKESNLLARAVYDIVEQRFGKIITAAAVLHVKQAAIRP